VSALDLPEGLTPAEGEHLRGLVAGPVTALEEAPPRAVLEVVDWSFAPACRFCGGPL
jgi:hypothetical protein